MTGDKADLPQYNLSTVMQVILEEAIEVHPRCLTIGALCQRIVVDPKDNREVETAKQAVRELRQSGLFSYKDDDQVVEPTPAARQAFALLAGYPTVKTCP
ncbi:MAG TPA: hypothetical protein VN756_00485 [Solirubrobacterales bacterium]|nr:hypothetical protein [Solirubrobacterales bacterium]